MDVVNAEQVRKAVRAILLTADVRLHRPASQRRLAYVLPYARPTPHPHLTWPAGVRRYGARARPGRYPRDGWCRAHGEHASAASCGNIGPLSVV